MRFGQGSLVVLAVLLLISVSFGKVLGTDDRKVESVSYTPEPVYLGIQLMSEDSAELWRREVRSSDGKKVVEVHVAYRDQRMGTFYFDSLGKLSRYTCAGPDSGRIFFEAEFDKTASIVNSRTFRPDGTLETQIRRLPEGEERSFLAADGMTVVRSVLTRADGSQKLISLSGGARTESQLPAAKVEQSVGRRVTGDGTSTPVLKMQLTGARVTSWQYFDADGKHRHNGSFEANGDVRISVLNDDGEPVLTQTWVYIGQDWNRGFYRLTQVEILDPSAGNVRCFLWEDGITVKSIANLNIDGTPVDTMICDRRGVPVRYDTYDSEGKVSHSQELEETESITLEDAGIEPGNKDAGGPVYRLSGVPFAEPLSADGGFFRIRK